MADARKKRSGKMKVALAVLRKIAGGSYRSSAQVAQHFNALLSSLYIGKYGGYRNRTFYPSDLSNVVDRLKRQGYIHLTHGRTGMALRLTPDGQELLALYEMKGTPITPPKRWDGMWRVIIFDVSEQRRYLRERIRRQLQEWDFYQLQKSVYAFPYPCEDLIELLKTGHRVRHDLLYMAVSELPYDNKLRKHYGLPLRVVSH